MTGFTSYAQARGFDPVQIPSETILRNLLRQQKGVEEGMKMNQQLQKQFATSWFNALQSGNKVTVDSLRTRNKLAQEDRARLIENHFNEMHVAMEEEKHSRPTSKASVADALGEIAKFVPQIAQSIGAIRQEQAQGEYKEGLFLIDQLGATPEQYQQLRNLEEDLFLTNQAYVAAAQEILPHATEKDIVQIRNSSGWVHYGMQQSALNNSIPIYHQHLNEVGDTEYPISDTEDMSLNQAQLSGNTSAANVILSQIQRDFAAGQFAELGIETPEQAFAADYFEKLRKVTDARYQEAWKQSEKQAQAENKTARQIESINALKKGGLKAWNSDVLEMYRDDTNKNWRKIAISENFPHLLSYLNMQEVPISEAEAMLTATREDGKTPFLGLLRREQIREVIAKKIGIQDQVRESMVSDRKVQIEAEKLKINTAYSEQGLNNAALEQLWQQYKTIPEIREHIQSLMVPAVSPTQEKIETARLNLLSERGELTTQAVLQSKTSQATRLKFLGMKGIDRPYPEQSNNLKSDIQSLILQKMSIASYEQMGSKEPSVRMATDDITAKAVRRFVSLMGEGTMSADEAYNDALGYGKGFVEALEAKPFKLDDPNSGYIEGYTVDANEKPVSTVSRKHRRKLMQDDPEFYKNTPLDVKQDYEYLRQKLLSSGNYDTIVNDKFSWVRDVVGLYNGRLTKEEILAENAKTLGVNLVFPESIVGEPSNISPGALQQWRVEAKTLNSNLGNLNQRILQQNEQRGWRSADTMSRYTPQSRLLARALRKQESGNPSAVNVHSGASGMYQIMPANIPGWSKEALGREVSYNEYMGNPVIQEQIAMFHINKALQHQIAAGYKGDLAIRRAASIWYSGNAGLYDDTRDQSRDGTRYPTIQEYTLSILGKYKALAGGQ